MSDNETDAFTDAGSGGRSAAFTDLNKWVVGTVVKIGEKQQTAFGTKEPVFWKDGSPKMQMVVTLATDERDPEDPDDDGLRSIYCKWGQHVAIGDAIKAAGHRGAMVGGRLGLCWSGSDDTGKGNPLKLWKAKFEPPAQSDAFNDEPPSDEEPF